MTSLAQAFHGTVLNRPEVTRLSALQRAAWLFSQGQVAESVYFIEEGLVKLTRSNDTGDKLILEVRGPDHLVGEEALTAEPGGYYCDAEVLTAANIYRIPRELAQHAVATEPETASAAISYLLQRRRVLAEKVELLCLRDVEYRIIHYLVQLSSLLRPTAEGHGIQIPITQLELADLIGATRETTSTTLNQLERRGLLKLSRRMLTIPSPEVLRDAAVAKTGAPAVTA